MSTILPFPAAAEDAKPFDALTPTQVVAALDRYIVGQTDAKRAVAVALRNRWRRQRLGDDLRDEVSPKNILMLGPTGCGKTEISRRLAKLADAPFLKIEATKFTEVGYVGRDVDSIIRDLVEESIRLVRDNRRTGVKEAAEAAAEARLLDVLVGKDASEATRLAFRDRFRSGALKGREVEIEVADSGGQSFDIPGMQPGQVGMINLSDMLGKAMAAAPSAARCRSRRPGRRWSPRRATSASTTTTSPATRSGAPSRTASSSSTRSTRSRSATCAAARSAARACSATCCR